MRNSDLSALDNIVRTKLAPDDAKTQDTRNTSESALSSSTARSPASFDAPYTLIGFGGSVSEYALGLRPSNT